MDSTPSSSGLIYSTIRLQCRIHYLLTWLTTVHDSDGFLKRNSRLSRKDQSSNKVDKAQSCNMFYTMHLKQWWSSAELWINTMNYPGLTNLWLRYRFLSPLPPLDQNHRRTSHRRLDFSQLATSGIHEKLTRCTYITGNIEQTWNTAPGWAITSNE
jgi:hypothetical protein